MGNRELDLIHKICNTQDFDEILLNIVKQRKDNWIKRILDNISEDVSIGEETKRQIYETIFKYVNDINDNIKMNIKEIYINAVVNTINWIKHNQKEKGSNNSMKSKIKVIIVDDDMVTCELLEKYLKKYYNSIEILGIANTAEEEFEMIENLKPEIVITDLLKNGNYTGLDIIKEYYEKKRGPEFLVLSVDRKQEVINNGLEVAGYIQKPFSNYEMVCENLIRIKHELEYKKHLEEYHNKEIIDLTKHFSSEELGMIEQLGIKIKDKIYTEYEYELLNIELFIFYRDEDMNEEELKKVRPLENTGISRKQYNSLIEKVEKINEIYNF